MILATPSAPGDGWWVFGFWWRVEGEVFLVEGGGGREICKRRRVLGKRRRVLLISLHPPPSTKYPPPGAPGVTMFPVCCSSVWARAYEVFGTEKHGATRNDKFFLEKTVFISVFPRQNFLKTDWNLPKTRCFLPKTRRLLPKNRHPSPITCHQKMGALGVAKFIPARGRMKGGSPRLPPQPSHHQQVVILGFCCLRHSPCGNGQL